MQEENKLLTARSFYNYVLYCDNNITYILPWL